VFVIWLVFCIKYVDYVGLNLGIRPQNQKDSRYFHKFISLRISIIFIIILFRYLYYPQLLFFTKDSWKVILLGFYVLDL
jgi:hypothetical protein